MAVDVDELEAEGMPEITLQEMLDDLIIGDVEDTPQTM